MKDFLQYLRENRVSYLVSILTLVMTFMVSTLSFLVYNVADTTSQNMEDKVQIIAYVDSLESEYFKDTAREGLESLPNVDKVVYKESAEELEGFIEDLDLGGELFQDVLEENPLEDTLYIHLKDSSKIESTYNQVLELEEFDEESVLFNEEGVEIVENLNVMVNVSIITLIIVVSTITIPIINILVKNSIDARSSEIRVKRLIGAKKFSIISPILLELLVMLLLAILLFSIISYYLLKFLRDAIDSFGVSMIEVGSLTPIFTNSLSVNLVFGLVLMLGMLLYVSVRKIKV